MSRSMSLMTTMTEFHAPRASVGREGHPLLCKANFHFRTLAVTACMCMWLQNWLLMELSSESETLEVAVVAIATWRVPTKASFPKAFQAERPQIQHLSIQAVVSYASNVSNPFTKASSKTLRTNHCIAIVSWWRGRCRIE